MNYDLAISLLILLVGTIAGFFLAQFLPTYFTEKGKNLATKEDIAVITERVERTKAQYSSEIEKLKAEIQKDLVSTEKKREIYQEIAKSLNVFISGRTLTGEEKQKFLDDYSLMWLWSSDNTLRALNKYLSINMVFARAPEEVSQETMVRAFSEIIIEMRKDAGYLDTQINPEEYRPVSFK